MAQASGPKTDKTFTDAEWRRGIGPEPYIAGDLDGTSYAIQLANNSDVASIGSSTQESTAVVGGFPHWIPAGQPEGITIPGATTSARTDLIVLRYDPTWGATDPGPVRLFRIAGTEGAGVPTYDAAPPGVEDFPLWAVTRQPGQALSQASTTWLGLRGGPNLYAQTVTQPLPASAPLGTRVQVSNNRAFTRMLDDQMNPAWFRQASRIGNTETVTTNIDGIAVITHFLGYAPTKVTVVTAKTADVPEYTTLIADPVVWFVSDTVIHLRVRRLDRAVPEWMGGFPVGVTWSAE